MTPGALITKWQRVRDLLRPTGEAFRTNWSATRRPAHAIWKTETPSAHEGGSFPFRPKPMRKLLKTLHSLASCGLIGGLLVYAILLAEAYWYTLADLAHLRLSRAFCPWLCIAPSWTRDGRGSRRRWACPTNRRHLKEPLTIVGAKADHAAALAERIASGAGRRARLCAWPPVGGAGGAAGALGRECRTGRLVAETDAARPIRCTKRDPGTPGNGGCCDGGTRIRQPFGLARPRCRWTCPAAARHCRATLNVGTRSGFAVCIGIQQTDANNAFRPFSQPPMASWISN